MKKFFVLLVLILSMSEFVCGRIRYVTPRGAGLKNGTSWQNAYDGTQLQTAINEPDVSGVYVAAGTYKPTNGTDRTISFHMKNGVAVYGGFAGWEGTVDERNNWGIGQVNETILSGDLKDNDGKPSEDFAENAYHVVYNSGINSTAIIDGFTITGGNANGDDYAGTGGGIYNSSSSPTITNCSLKLNFADRGGGGIYNLNSSPTLTHCLISNNHTSFGGGGVFNYASSLRLTSCTISDNLSVVPGGGGIFNTTSSIVLVNCIIKYNWGEHGGGICNENSSTSDLFNCIISENGADGWGGGLSNSNSTATLINCLLSGNSNYVMGGALYNDKFLTLTNCTIAGNIVWCDGGGIYNSGTLKLNNCIVWDNSAGYKGHQLFNYGTIMLNYSCYANMTEDTYNEGTFTPDTYCLTTDPLFVNAANNDYRIEENSACKDAGNAGYNTEVYDIRGQARIQDGTIDMGAYEWTLGIDPFGSLSAPALNDFDTEFVEVYAINGAITVTANESITGFIKITDITGGVTTMMQIEKGLPLNIKLAVAPGFYLVSLFTKAKTYSRKIIVVK